MAGNAIDSMTDVTAHADDRANRKRRLLKGPEEFREVRVDRKRKRLPVRVGSGLKGEEAMKIPGEAQPPKPITKAEREARKAFRQVDAEKAMTEHEIAQKAFSNNRERLKAERLAREAAGTPVAKTKAKPKTKKKL
jgi:hypothetical protein